MLGHKPFLSLPKICRHALNVLRKRPKKIVRHNHEKPVGGYLAGKITDTYGVPLAGAAVWVQSEQKGTMTGLSGDYVLSLSVGVFDIEIRFLGYEPVQVSSVDVRAKQTTTFAMHTATHPGYRCHRK